MSILTLINTAHLSNFSPILLYFYGQIGLRRNRSFWSRSLRSGTLRSRSLGSEAKFGHFGRGHYGPGHFGHGHFGHGHFVCILDTNLMLIYDRQIIINYWDECTSILRCIKIHISTCIFIHSLIIIQCI